MIKGISKFKRNIKSMNLKIDFNKVVLNKKEKKMTTHVEDINSFEVDPPWISSRFYHDPLKIHFFSSNPSTPVK